jgi:hypothetical protein
MLTQTAPTTMPVFTSRLLPMSTPVLTTVRRRPATALLPQPSFDDMLRFIKEWDPLTHAALKDATAYAFHQLKAKRRKASLDL